MFTGVSIRVAVIMFVVSECHLDEENFSMLCPRHKVHMLHTQSFYNCSFILKQCQLAKVFADLQLELLKPSFETISDILFETLL